MRWWPSGGLWHHADFLRLWGAQTASTFGSKITRTALPILAILSLGATSTQVAMLAALSTAPGVLVGLCVSGYIDRTAKRPLLIIADLIRALLLLTIPLASWFGVLSLPQLYVVVAAVGVATTLFQIADNSLLPTLVGTDMLVEGNAKLEATEAIAEAAGPGLAGVLIQLLTAPMTVVVDALSYIYSAFLLSRMQRLEAPTAVTDADASVLGDILIGARASLAHPLVGPMLLADGVMFFFGGFFHALYILLALEALALSPAAVGIIISVGGIGSCIGAMIAKPLGHLGGTGPAMALSLGLGQAANLLIPLALDGGILAIPCLVLQQFVGDACLSAYLIHALSLRQSVLPHTVLGRANATFHGLTGLLLPAGALAAGPLADAIGLSATLWIGAGGGLLAAPVLMSSPILQRR
jgi:predicted MFS family arabinose efflux permease